MRLPCTAPVQPIDQVMANLKSILRRCGALAGVEQTATTHAEKLVSALGALVGVLIVSWTAFHFLGEAAAPVVASMGASAVLLFAVPHGVLSQPWPLVGGHLISAMIGVACQLWVPSPLWAAALAVGLAVGAMYYLRCIHPPGGATALTAVIGGEAVHSLGFGFVLYPVALNVIAILLTAVLFNSFFAWRRYPGHFARRRSGQLPIKTTAPSTELTHEDFAAALQELNSLIDVTADDLVELFEKAAQHAEKNAPHPPELAVGRYYSNGQLGQRWSIRQIIDAPTDPHRPAHKLIYKIVAGNGAYQTGICSHDEFGLWARFEVVAANGHWLRV